MKRVLVLLCLVFIQLIAWGCNTNKEPEPKDEPSPITVQEADQAIKDYYDDYNDFTLDNDDFFESWSNDLVSQIDEYYTRRSVVHLNNFNFGFKYLSDDSTIFRNTGLRFEDLDKGIILNELEIINTYSDQVTFDMIILFDTEIFLLDDSPEQEPLIVKETEIYALLWRNSNDAVQVHVLFTPVPITDSWITPRVFLDETETISVLELFLNDLMNPDYDDWELANQYFLGDRNHHFKGIRETVLAGGYTASLLHILDPFSLDGIIPFEVVITYDDPGGDFEEHDILSLLIEVYDGGHYHIQVYCALPDLPHYEEPQAFIDDFLQKLNGDIPNATGCEEDLDWTEIGDCRKMRHEIRSRDLVITHGGCSLHTSGGHSVCEVPFNIELGDEIYTTFTAYVYLHGDELNPYMTLYPTNLWHQIYAWITVYDYFIDVKDALNDSTLSDGLVCSEYGYLFHDCLELRSLLLEAHIVGIIYHSLDNTYSIHWQFDMISSDIWYYHVTISWNMMSNPFVIFKSAIIIP